MSKNNSIQNCNCCPRQCNVNRGGIEVGFCNTDDQPLISSIFLHKGEEPVISGKNGICNVFFAHCNLQCIYCQNYQISLNNRFDPRWRMSIDEAVSKIVEHLSKGVKLLGFVSPSHQTNQMLDIVDKLWSLGYKPTIVYNSNGYDSVETLKQLEGIVDVYLPDFKYFSNDISLKYSGVLNYFDIASNAVKEMYRQKGSYLLLGEDGLAESGIVVRHLVLPGLIDESIRILEYIADEISPFLRISLMSQYYPTKHVGNDILLGHKVSAREYEKVVKKFNDLKFEGWIQDIESSELYQPDFYRDTPFL